MSLENDRLNKFEIDTCYLIVCLSRVFAHNKNTEDEKERLRRCTLHKISLRLIQKCILHTLDNLRNNKKKTARNTVTSHATSVSLENGV